ncbi:Dimodular nonribosomal peptide synthase [Planctomycetes bacterium CA13]|uniref:Dimodular nonribosomal peptide synthase n=1 Tax=Novipirellula herctigrandis TaxID=2527986 RepID=A0A5C5Z410_9BACT|nr:Dimodular nonribosomal peptide synthase [Planctomycetes bacterium CA13]
MGKLLTGTSDRKASAESAIGSLLSEASGFELSELDQEASFAELGLDSLFLVQFSQKIKSQLKVKVTFRQLIEEIPTINALIAYVAQRLPDEFVVGGQPAETPATEPIVVNEPSVIADSSQPTNTASADLSAPPIHPASPVIPNPPDIRNLPVQAAAALPPMPIGTGPSAAQDRASLSQIIAQQNELMSLQLQLLAGARPAAPTPSTRASAVAPQVSQTASPSVSSSASSSQISSASPSPNGSTKPVVSAPLDSAPKTQILERFGPFKPVRRAPDGGLTDQQQRHLDNLIARFTNRTAKSRKHAQQHRGHFADPRGVAGYRRIWKAMVYQISVDRSKGSKLWDIDGNEYIDIAMGFGLNLFGQSPDFITEAIAKQLAKGVEVGPQSPLAGEVAQLLCDFSRKSRVSFCNTGSEAVMAAMRLARTVTGKSKIVFFNKDYHGNFDQVLVRSITMGNKRRSQPAAPGVPQPLADLTIVLDYGTDEALQAIRDNADDIAAVLVEPVQSANPFMKPKAFLQEVRQITEENDIALIMDEVITGFRAAPGGAQEWFGVWGDMATYGKVLGGGLPIGALAGSAKYMDALDGGNWRYEDDSEPTADMTFYAGTFVRHPLAITAAHQVLMKVKESGPELQKGLTEKTTYLVDSLNQFFEKELYPLRVAQFTSLFRFMFPPTMEYADLLYFHLLDRGVFTRGWGDNCFLSTAHSDTDIERIIEAVKDSCNEIREGGFLPDPRSSDTQKIESSATTQSPLFEKKKCLRFPLTEAQLEIWVTSQMGNEASCSYNEPFSVRFRGQLNCAILCDAIQTVVARHKTLHYRIAADGQYQEVHNPQPVTIDRHDLRGIPSDQQNTSLAEFAGTLGSKSFDFSAGPLIRLALTQLADDEHILFVSAHHIVSDGWSTNLMLSEIAEAYTATAEQRDIQLAEPADYRDYAAMELAAQDESTEALSYWRDQYRDPPAPLELPVDRPRPAVKSFAGSTLIHHFKDDTYQAMKKTAAEKKVTLFSMTFAVLNVLLARLSGQDDIVVSIPTAGQVLQVNQCLVGHCVNLLPIRSQIKLDDSFDRFLVATQTQVLDGFDHQQCTLGKIVRELRIPRDPSRLPLVEINFNFDRDGMGLEFPSLEVEVAQTVKRASTFDLFFNLNETADGLELYLDYSTALYDEDTIRRWVGHYETLLQEIAKDPSQSLGEISLLSDHERHQILVDWNSTNTVHSNAKPVHNMFEQQVHSTPGRVAVVADDRQFSYQQINELANGLARHLQSVGVNSGDLVGVHLERSEWMVIATLAILKAGAAYVPLDPNFPAKRLAMMAEDAELSVIVTQQSLPTAEIAPHANRILVDEDLHESFAADVANLEVSISPDQVAYVIYTSGSTGKPKGVEIGHSSLTNFLCSMQHQPGLNENDVLLSVTTLSFDIAALEIFLPIVSGARVVLVSSEEAMDGPRLSQHIEALQTTVMQATPATWKMLIDSGWHGKQGLKILCGGEAMPNALARELLDRGDSVWNLYGPTETTIWSTVRQIQSSETVNIGHPIANTEIFVLDERHRPVPIGVAGRMFIGGSGLAHGYRHLPELTAEKFIAHPFRNQSELRIYDTGDQARYRADGTLDFLGRLDHQAKIRGFRIELDEIEHELSKHPDLNQAVVVVSPDGEDASLVAYCVPDPHSESPSPLDLREFLRQTLPEYMIPSIFVMLQELPMTPNRKVDRRALPKPVLDREQLSVGYTAPRDHTEMEIANIWKRTLKLDRIGRDDDFFDAGGHSLLAARMMLELEKRFGERVPLATLLTAPTVRQFAELMKRKDWRPRWHCLVPIQERGNKPPLFCVHAAHGNVMLYRELAMRLGDDQPVYGLQSRGLDGELSVHTTIRDMASEYVEEIRKVQPNGPYHLCGYCLGGAIAYEMAQQLSAEGEEIELLGLFDTTTEQFKETFVSANYRRLQNIGFHAANLVRRGPRGAYAFLRGKLAELRSRLFRRTAVSYSSIACALKLRENPPLQLLERINDKANESYVPQRYGGRVTLFRPCKAYAGYEDPSLGWGNGLVDDLEVVELDVYPAGMLMEPYVQDLASQVQRRLSPHQWGVPEKSIQNGVSLERVKESFVQ